MFNIVPEIPRGLKESGFCVVFCFLVCDMKMCECGKTTGAGQGASSVLTYKAGRAKKPCSSNGNAILRNAGSTI